MRELPVEITCGDKYGPAMKITDLREADEYFDILVRHSMSSGKSHEEAEVLDRSNLGYYAGYYDGDTRMRVERLFKCFHPMFGAISENGQPTQEEAFELGNLAGKASMATD